MARDRASAPGPLEEELAQTLGLGEHLRPALDQANLLSRLIDDLRTLALAEAGQLPLLRRPTHLADLIASHLTSLEAQAAAQQVTTRVA